MEIEYDKNKNERNIRERGLSFEEAEYFDFETARFTVDTRKNYGETRIVALGTLYERVHVLVFKKIEGGIRVISFRKANKREINEYEIFRR